MKKRKQPAGTPGVLGSPDRAAKREKAGGYRWKGGGGGASTAKKRRVHEYLVVTFVASAGLLNEWLTRLTTYTHTRRGTLWIRTAPGGQALAARAATDVRSARP